jgi:hypothetical protein
VSGTCPLCRIDLRPATTNGEEAANGNAATEDGNAALPPPLGMDDPSVETANGFGRARRNSMPSLTHMRNASNPQERIAALRHLRDASRTLPQREASTVSRHSVTSRLRDRFRIRTTRARASSVDDMQEDRRASGVLQLNPLILTGLPLPAVPGGGAGAGAAELRPLREVYRVRRRRSG